MSDNPLLAQIAQGWNPANAINMARGIQDYRTQQFNLQQQKLQPAYAGLNALLENPNAGWGDVNEALANSERLGGDTSGLVAAASDFAANGGSPADFIRQYGTARYVPPAQAADLFLPQTATMDMGGGIAPVTIGARGSATPGALNLASPMVPRTLTPGQQVGASQWMNQPHSWIDPATGAPVQGTIGQYLQNQGIALPSWLASPGGAAAAGGGAGPVSSVTTGRAPVSTAGATGTGAPVTSAPLPPAAAPGAAAAAPSPYGAPAALLPPATLTGGQNAYAADTAMQRTLGTRIAPLENALSVLRSNPNMATGPGQTEFASAATGIASAFGLPTPNQATAFQELSKYLTQYMRNMPGANRSDLAQLEAQASSPNPEQSRPAMETLLAKAVGYERLQTAPLDWFNSQYPDAPTAARNSGQYLMRSSAWAQTQDPVAYSVDEMTPDMVQSYFNGLSGTATADKQGNIHATGAKQRFIASRAEAQKLYPWLTVGAAPPAQVATPAPTPASAP
jgi:hypothetical protein